MGSLDAFDRLPDLICPSCAKALTRDQDGFSCLSGHIWPEVQGVPRFVSSEHYTSSFGYQWTRFARTQFDDQHRTRSESSFRQRTGFTPDDLRGALVLDVGCGSGRYADIASRWGARVVAFDLSHAVDAAHTNFRDRDNVAIMQADIFALPFAPASFDFIFSIGVLHHTPDTRRAFLQLPHLLRPGGSISIWVYPQEWASPGSEFLRKYTTKLSNDRLMKLARIAHPLYHIKRKAPRSIRFALNYLIPTSMEADPEWRVLDTFDWYAPPYQWKHTYPEVYGWFREAGLEQIQLGGDPISVNGRSR